MWNEQEKAFALALYTSQLLVRSQSFRRRWEVEKGEAGTVEQEATRFSFRNKSTPRRRSCDLLTPGLRTALVCNDCGSGFWCRDNMAINANHIPQSYRTEGARVCGVWGGRGEVRGAQQCVLQQQQHGGREFHVGLLHAPPSDRHPVGSPSGPGHLAATLAQSTFVSGLSLPV